MPVINSAVEQEALEFLQGESRHRRTSMSTSRINSYWIRHLIYVNQYSVPDMDCVQHDAQILPVRRGSTPPDPRVVTLARLSSDENAVNGCPHPIQ